MRLHGGLAQLDAEQFKHMVAMLGMGSPDRNVARHLLSEGWVKGVSEDALTKSVNRWRKGGGQDLVVQQVAEFMTTSDGNLKQQLDVGAEMTEAYFIQKKRFQKALAQEQDKPLVLKMVTEEEKVLFTMLVQIGKWQLDSGIVRKVRVGETQEDYAEYKEVDPEDGFSEEDLRLIEIARAELDELGE